jgi:fermentation-respiration switch protein FrsA (DUF1100 family)
MAWAVWKRTVGRLGERHRRWARRQRCSAGSFEVLSDRRARCVAIATMLIRPMRFCLVVCVFAPLVFGSLVHRIKIGNAEDKGGYASLPIETVAFKTADGLTLSGWFLPDDDSDATVVICHGLGANKGNFAEFLSVFYGQGYNSLIFDFRGHGESDGHTSTWGLLEARDVRAAVDWLRRERPERARWIAGLGSSMGAMALLREAADDRRIEAVVLDSCYASAPLLLKQHAAWIPVLGRLLADVVLAATSLHAGHSMWVLDGREKIGELSPRPVLLIHGEDDFVIPPVNMNILYDCARETKQKWLGPGPHSNIMIVAFDDYRRRVIDFLNRAKASSAAQHPVSIAK